MAVSILSAFSHHSLLVFHAGISFCCLSLVRSGSHFVCHRNSSSDENLPVPFLVLRLSVCTYARTEYSTRTIWEKFSQHIVSYVWSGALDVWFQWRTLLFLVWPKLNPFEIAWIKRCFACAYFHFRCISSALSFWTHIVGVVGVDKKETATLVLFVKFTVYSGYIRCEQKFRELAQTVNCVWVESNCDFAAGNFEQEKQQHCGRWKKIRPRVENERLCCRKWGV